jgi:hypothetical protein
MKKYSLSTSIAGTLAAFLFTLALTSCDEDTPPLPDAIIQFETDDLGFASHESSVTARLVLTREIKEAITVTLSITANGVAPAADFTTAPAMENNGLSLVLPPGATETSFTITKKEELVLDGDESIEIALNAVSGIVVGEKNRLTVRFSEILSARGTMDPTVGGQAQPNKVFVDLSANRQTVVNRSDWDLGFYTLNNQFRVVLNTSSSMLAIALDKNDLASVTVSDTVGLGNKFSTDAIFAAIQQNPIPEWTKSSMAWIDAPSGNLEGTAIAEVSSTPTDNKVYIINRGKNPDGTQRGWKKIRVLRNGSHYILQHADINATAFTTVEIARDADYLFNYVKFESGVVAIEPRKDRWDIAFTVFTNSTPAGPSLVVPYVFSDIVLQNRYNTETAELLIPAAGSYESFDESKLSLATFSNSQTNIGSKWRTGGGPGSAPALRTDRFYLVKDSGGNIYKLRFTALTQNGERGRPQIEYALVKKG